jgi:hypothetical protein
MPDPSTRATFERILSILGATEHCYVCDSEMLDGLCQRCIDTRHTEQIALGLKTLFAPTDLLEMRFFVKNVNPEFDDTTEVGYYTDHRKLAEALRELSCKASTRAVYYVLNVISRDVMQRPGFTLNSYGSGRATGNLDIARRRWLFVDVDPVREHGSSTDAEKAVAHEMMIALRDYLTSCGWPTPVSADSSNGYHLHYRIDLPNKPESNALISGCLNALNQRFSTEQCKVDPSVGNAARICKAYGTFSRKGDDLLDRPWRESRILTVPNEIVQVSEDQLRALAALAPLGGGGGKSSGNFRPLRDDFDIHEFAAHYDLDILNPGGLEKGDGITYYYLRDCPIKGAPHCNKSKTALTMGDTLGFNCFSANCCQPDGSKHTLASLRTLLHRKYEKFPGGVFASPEPRNRPSFADEAELVTADHPDEPMEDVVEKTPVVVNPEAPVATILAPAKPAARPFLDDYSDMDPKIPVKESFDAEDFDFDFGPEPPIPTFALDMPDDCMFGWLGDQVAALRVPKAWGYASLLTIYAAHGVNLDELEGHIRPTLYTCLLGAAGDGKSTAIRRAMKYLTVDDGVVNRRVPSSDKGLFRMFAPPKPPKRLPNCPPEPVELRSYLLLQDELKATMAKMAINNSTLTTTLCELFYEDEAGGADKASDMGVYMRLNILGALKAEDATEFAESFGSSTTGGLYDRFLFIPGPRNWKPKGIWQPAPRREVRRPLNTIRGVGVYRAHKMKDAWCEVPDTDRRRVGELALRVAMVTASANGDSTITEECMAAALRFMEWQEKVRKAYSAGVAANPDAVVASAILDAFEEYRDAEGKPQWVKFWDVGRKKNWSKKYGSTVTRVRKSLAEERSLLEESEDITDKNGDPTGKSRSTGCYRLPQ